MFQAFSATYNIKNCPIAVMSGKGQLSKLTAHKYAIPNYFESQEFIMYVRNVKLKTHLELLQSLKCLDLINNDTILQHYYFQMMSC